MANSTNYDIRLRYLLETAGAGASVDKLAKKMDGLGATFSRTRNLVMGYLGGQAAAKALIGYNVDIENSVTTLATSMFGFGKARTFGDAMQYATKLAGDYREVAKKSLGESKDFIGMHQNIQATMLNSGFTLDEVKTATIGATTASQIFGKEAGMAALDIKQMTMGTVTARDELANLLIGMYATSKGLKDFGAEQWNKLAKENPAKLRKALLEALDSDPLRKAADQMGASFGGQLSTVTDNAKQVLGAAGKPLFEVLTKELTKVNAWIEKNKDLVDKWSKSVGEGLVTGFTVLKDVFSFIAANADTLIRVAMAFAAIKFTRGLAGTLQSLSSAGGLMASFGGGRMVAGEGGAMVANTLKGSVQSAGALNAVSGVLAAGIAGYELGTELNKLTGASTALADGWNRVGTWLGAWGEESRDMLRQSNAALSAWTSAVDASTRKAEQALKGKGGVAGTMVTSNLTGQAEIARKEATLVEAFVKANALASGTDGFKHGAARDFARQQALDFGISEKMLNAQGAASLASKATGMEDRARFLQGDKAKALLDEARLFLTEDKKAFLEANGGLEWNAARQMLEIMRQNQPITLEALTTALTNMGTTWRTTMPLGGKAEDVDKSQSKGTRVSVNVQRIEVQNDNPERFVMDLMSNLQKSIKSPSASRALRRAG